MSGNESVMVVNMVVTPGLNPPNREVVKALLKDLCDYYQIDYSLRPDIAHDYFLKGEGVDVFTKWVQERYGITARYFCFRTGSSTLLGYGFEFVADENLTAYLLKTKSSHEA